MTHFERPGCARHGLQGGGSAARPSIAAGTCGNARRRQSPAAIDELDATVAAGIRGSRRPSGRARLRPLRPRGSRCAFVERAAGGVRADRHPREQRGCRGQRRPAPPGRVQGRVLGPDARGQPDCALLLSKVGAAAHAHPGGGGASSRWPRSGPARLLPHGGAYTASKHGVRGLMRTLALEARGRGDHGQLRLPGACADEG